MKIKTFIAAVALAVAALAFSSCSKTDTGKDAGGYYIEPQSEATGLNAAFILSCNAALRVAFGDGIVYKTSANDSKAIAAIDAVHNEQKSLISISFDLVFKTAVASGETPKVTKIKTYKPAN